MSVRTEHPGGLALGRPGDAVYAKATAAFNLTARIRPAAATVARSTDEVVGAVRQARRLGMPVRVAATGHGATAKAPLDGALLIRTEIGGGVRVDCGARRAVVPAGTTWAAVVAATSGHGLVAVHGSAGTVGAVGYLLRGGISFYGRRFGLGANSLRSVTVVLADGETRVASAEHDPELFWAVRGGGGGFGVVTEVEVDLHPMAAIVTGATVWGADAAQAIASLWARWARDAPPEVSTSLRPMNLPPAPGIPSLLTAGQIVVLDGAVAAETPTDRARAEHVAAGLLAPLRAVAEPVMDTWNTGMTVPSVVENHADAQRTYDDPTALDVDAVRRRVDPERVFRGDVDPIRDREVIAAAHGPRPT